MGVVETLDQVRMGDGSGQLIAQDPHKPEMATRVLVQSDLRHDDHAEKLALEEHRSDHQRFVDRGRPRDGHRLRMQLGITHHHPRLVCATQPVMPSPTARSRLSSVTAAYSLRSVWLTKTGMSRLRSGASSRIRHWS